MEVKMFSAAAFSVIEL